MDKIKLPKQSRLTIVERIGNDRALCLCSCGNQTVKRLTNVLYGFTRSCGCLQRELRMAGGPRKTHGMTNRPVYRVWCTMKARCYNPKTESYPRYGGRGITVCDRWLESFENFYSDMGPRPSAKHTLERKNNDGNYCPENCEWIVAEKQASNRRNNHLVTFRGRTLPISHWNSELGFPTGTISQRMQKLGWSAEKAMTTPIRVFD